MIIRGLGEIFKSIPDCLKKKNFGKVELVKRANRKRKSSTLGSVLHVLGQLVFVEGALLLIPFLLGSILGELECARVFLLPALISFGAGFMLYKVFRAGPIGFIQSLLICGLGWIVLSFFGALPFWMGSEISYFDAYYETMNGLTTTGFTIYTDIEILPKGLLFWRSFLQWLGGLGILTLFLAVTFKSNNAYFQLFSAESHKVEATRPTPSIFKTVLILWGLYVSFTCVEIILLTLLGMGVFDSICHSLATISTGGFSNYNASMDHFRQAGYAHYKLIQYTVIFFMFLGGINFLFLYLVFIRKRFMALVRNTEFRYYFWLIVGCTSLIMLDHLLRFSGGSLEEVLRHSLFTVVALITSTGYQVVEVGDPFFPAMARQVIILLMLIGGCVGSTAGGLKVLRITVLFKLFKLQIKKILLPKNSVSGVVLDGGIFPSAEILKLSGIFFGWIILIVGGGLVTALFAHLDSWQSMTGMLSAVGNMGPCFFSVEEMAQLPAVVKLTYMLGMLAGRLELLPVLLLFNLRSWR